MLLLPTIAVAESDLVRWNEYDNLFTNIHLRAIDFKDISITDCIDQINRQIQNQGEQKVRLLLDFTPTQYKIVPEILEIRLPASELIRWWSNGVDVATSLTNVPLVFIRADQINLNQFLKELRGALNYKLSLYVKKNEILLRPGPPLIECRAYRFYKNKNYKELFDNHPFILKHTKWLEDSNVLLYVNTPELLNSFDWVLKQTDYGQRILQSAQQPPPK